MEYVYLEAPGGSHASAGRENIDKVFAFLKRAPKLMPHLHDRSNPISRREVLRLLGGAAGIGVLEGCRAFSAGESSAGSGLAGVPDDAMVRTLLGDITPGAIRGATLFHEHLSIRLNPDRPSATDDVDNVIREVLIAAEEGVGCIVDGGHPDMRRDLAAVRRVAVETGVHVVASGGYYMERYYPPEIATSSEDLIAEELVAEASRDRLGAFGEYRPELQRRRDDSRRTEGVSRGWEGPRSHGNPGLHAQRVWDRRERAAGRRAHAAGRPRVRGRSAGAHRHRARMLPRRSLGERADPHR